MKRPTFLVSVGPLVALGCACALPGCDAFSQVNTLFTTTKKAAVTTEALTTTL